MSIVSIGALFLLGGILASSAGLISACTGASTAIYNISSYKNESQIINELFSTQCNTINDYVQNARNIIKSQLIQLRQIVSNMNVVQELENQKNRLLNEIDNLVNSDIFSNLSELDYLQTLQNSVKNITNIFNDLKSQNQVYLTQYQNIFNQVQEKINDLKKIDKNINLSNILNKDLKSCNLYELEKLSEDIEKIGLEITYKLKEQELIKNISKVEIVAVDNLKKEFYQEEQKKQLLKHIDNFIQKIKQLDDSYEIKTKLDNLDDIQDINNLTLIKDQISLEYYNLLNNIIYTDAYKERIQGYLNILDSLENVYKTDINFKKYYPYYEAIFKKIKMKLTDILNQKYITKQEALDIEKEFLDTVSLIEKSIELEYIKDTLKFRLNDILRDIGYSVIEQELIEKFYKGEVIYIDTIYGSNYKVQAKFSEGKLSLRLVKVFETQKDIDNLTDYERQMDFEVAKNWCKDLDKIIEKLKDNGILIETIKRIEPSESQITYIVNKELLSKSKVNKYFKDQKHDKYLTQTD